MGNNSSRLPPAAAPATESTSATASASTSPQSQQAPTRAQHSHSHSQSHSHSRSKSTSNNSTAQPSVDTAPRSNRNSSIRKPRPLESSHFASASINSTASASSRSTVYTPQSALSPPASARSSQSNHLRTDSSESSRADRPRSQAMGNSQSGETGRDKDARRKDRDHKAQSSPVQVPNSRQQGRNRGPSTQIEPSSPPQSVEYAPKSNLHFPPRLPLPIQEEVYAPGSPVVSREDLSTALNEDDVEGPLPHRASLLSHTTADEDEEGLEEYSLEGAKDKTVPTEVIWRGHAQKAYITGTFAAWSRKYRMHRDPKDPDLLSVKLDLPPGTHHVKFIIDGDMQLSNDLPTAVDYTNILVNYIEVSADDIPEDDAMDKVPEGLHPPLVVPSDGGVETSDFAPKHVTDKTPDTERPNFIETEDVHYAQTIPQYLQDLDRSEDTNRFRRGASYISETPNPPSLPLFLGKSILNGTTPMKDDSSVLNMPNHTVLNHLATSSIKNEVLATSVTTRYKRKYVTTITYKPSNPNDLSCKSDSTPSLRR